MSLFRHVPLASRHAVIATVMSILLHVGAFLGLVVLGWLVPLLFWNDVDALRPVVMIASAEPSRDPADGGVEAQAADEPTPDSRATDDETDDTRQRVAAESLPALVREAVDSSSSVPAEDQRQRAARLAQELENSTDLDDVGAAATTVDAALALPSRATRPAETIVPGTFDTRTAQFDDVTRTTDAGGRIVYHAVLLDAAGRTVDVELTAAEGEELFRTWQLIKENPFVERIYRGVVMSMLDRVLDEQVPAKEPTPPGESP